MQERNFIYSDLGKIDYQEAWDLQRELFDKRYKNELHDILLLLEHNHTYTLGKTADKNNLIGSRSYLEENEISVYDIDRGGDITYHGPGQIVGYPIISLENWKKDTHKYLRAIEEVIIRTCCDFGINSSRNEKFTGVWVDDKKIAAIGIKVSRWITMHGFAFNVNTDLKYFNGIIPCGIKDKAVTSLENELNQKMNLETVKNLLVKHFKDVFDYSGYEIRTLEAIKASGLLTVL